MQPVHGGKICCCKKGVALRGKWLSCPEGEKPKGITLLEGRERGGKEKVDLERKKDNFHGKASWHEEVTCKNNLTIRGGTSSSVVKNQFKKRPFTREGK